VFGGYGQKVFGVIVGDGELCARRAGEVPAVRGHLEREDPQRRPGG
jgi:hypothetical protein